MFSLDGTLDFTHWEMLSGNGGSAAWSGFNFLVGFVIVFRTSQAYTRFWSALGDTHQMMAAWLEAASSLVAFSRSSPADPLLVENWLHTVMRLFSLLSASALQELTDVAYHHTWGLPTLDASAIDHQSIETLDSSSCRVELLYYWIQQYVSDGSHHGVLITPPPLLSRTLAELTKGMDRYQDAMKHSKVPFPFPYAQTTLTLLIFHWILTPLVMVQWSSSTVGAGIFTFVQVFTLWCLNATAVGFERPFGGELNDIDHLELQMNMNKSIVNLMEPRTRRTPYIPSSTYLDIDVLRKRDTIHAAALHQEGWQLKDMSDENRHPLLRCCSRSRARGARSTIAVSTRYSSKRYGFIDGERTAVLTIGIVGSDLCLALPALPGDTRSTFEVLNVRGQPCIMRFKRIPIQERHLLHKVPDPAWNDDYLDFPVDFMFAAETLAKASESHKNKGSLASAKAEAKANQDDSKVITRGVSQHLISEEPADTPRDKDVPARAPLPGAVQDAEKDAHGEIRIPLADPTPLAGLSEPPRSTSDGQSAQTPAAIAPLGGPELEPVKPLLPEPAELERRISIASPRKEGPQDMVLPWGGETPAEEDLGEGSAHILPWGAAAPQEDSEPEAVDSGSRAPGPEEPICEAVSVPPDTDKAAELAGPQQEVKEDLVAFDHCDTSNLIGAAESALEQQPSPV
ncbi:unnamed protein product [Symbiodinium pilosum]|uniref:Uncharacterized protein n=1 Tax=Symbiodinium pilosum TaxID=2952 RepID=A0A812Q547_SYMPI|nr:unnamed protein product [Symbiodinium pilosum]